MNATFYISAAVALLATAMVITRASAVHALLYLIVSLLAVAVMFLTMGAPFVAALEVIIYAGAILVLFVFVVMMLNTGIRGAGQGARVPLRAWIGPGVMMIVLLAEMIWAVFGASAAAPVAKPVEPAQVGQALFGSNRYLLSVELASMLLLAALVGAYHLGRRYRHVAPKQDAANE